MKRITVFALGAALLALSACSDQDSPTRVAAPAEVPAPPATTPQPTPTPPLPSTAGVDTGKTAKDSTATDPKGTLTNDEEAKSMPMAGHGNNHSSPSLEPAKRPDSPAAKDSP